MTFQTLNYLPFSSVQLGKKLSLRKIYRKRKPISKILYQYLDIVFKTLFNAKFNSTFGKQHRVSSKARRALPFKDEYYFFYFYRSVK